MTLYDQYYTDIDECTEEQNDCDQICINTVGLYNCSCGMGYLLNEDGYQCNGTLKSIVIIITVRIGMACVEYHWQILMNVRRTLIYVSISASTQMAPMCVIAMKDMHWAMMDSLVKVGFHTEKTIMFSSLSWQLVS